MKRFLLVLGLIFVGCMAALAAGTQEDAATDSGLAIKPPGKFPIVSEPVTYKIVARKLGFIEDWTTNTMTKYMEEKTNVHLEWEVVPNNQAIRLMVTAGDVPDLMLGGFNNTDAMLYGEQGLLLELGDLINNNMPNLKSIFARFPNAEKISQTPTGDHYYFPRVTVQNHSHISGKYWMQKSWLDAVGMDVPTTTDELARVLRAFKSQDPNGNGKADEIPLMGAVNNIRFTPLPYLMSAFVLDDMDARLAVESGKVHGTANTPEWREGLRYIAGLYEEGLIDPATFTQNHNQLRQIASGEEDVVGSISVNHMQTGWLLGSKQYEDGFAVPPITGPAGVRTTFIQGIPSGDIPEATTVQIRSVLFAGADIENPEIIAQWVDYLLSFEGSMYARTGAEDVNWRRAKTSDPTDVVGQPATWVILTADPNSSPAYIQNYNWGQVFPIFDDEKVRLGQSQEAGAASYESFLYQATKLYMPFAAENQLPHAAGVGILPLSQDVEELAQIKSIITGFITESAIRFIVGDRNIDNEWDQYVQELKNLGYDRLIEIYQKSYDSYGF